MKKKKTPKSPHNKVCAANRRPNVCVCGTKIIRKAIHWLTTACCRRRCCCCCCWWWHDCYIDEMLFIILLSESWELRSHLFLFCCCCCCCHLSCCPYCHVIGVGLALQQNAPANPSYSQNGDIYMSPVWLLDDCVKNYVTHALISNTRIITTKLAFAQIRTHTKTHTNTNTWWHIKLL